MMKKVFTGIFLLGLLIANPVLADKGVTPMLKMDTTYHFMWFDPMIPAAPLPGRLPGTQWALAWEGTIQGDVNGVQRYWVELPFPTDLTGVGRWEIWDCIPIYPIVCNYDDPALLIMAGFMAFGYVTAIDWEGKGIVTYTRADHSEWFGRRTTDGGWVDFDAIPWYGEGQFVIYDRPSNKH